MNQEKAVYNVKSQKLKGYAQFIFNGGALSELKMNFKQELSDSQKKLFALNLPFHEQDLEGFQKLGFSITKKNLKQQMDSGLKVALWSKYYGKYVKQKSQDNAEAPKTYRIMPKEIGMLKNVEVSEKLLQAYFACEEWWCKTKSVGNYVSRINEVELLLVTPAAEAPGAKHPNKWDADYFKKLDSTLHSDYFRHLRELGYKPVKSRTGELIDWK